MPDNPKSAKPDAGVQTGMDIPQPDPGGMADWLFNKSNYQRQLIGLAVSWANLDVYLNINMPDGSVTAMPAAKPQITVKNSKLTLTVDLSNLPTSGGGSVPFSGNGPPAAGTLSNTVSYLAGPVPSVYIDTNASAWYYCTTAGTNATSVWKPISGAALSQYTFVSDGGDYIVCMPAGGGANVNITKSYKLRTSIAKETINGTEYDYSYALVNGVYQRTVSYSGLIEVQQVVPAWLVGDPIFAIGTQDINADGRAWAEI
jgi:hypothetical protein